MTATVAAIDGLWSDEYVATIHRTTLVPTELELLTAWLPGRPWRRGHDDASGTIIATWTAPDGTAPLGTVAWS
ncbi:hypothetical protein [Gordonia sp. NPDC003376]